MDTELWIQTSVEIQETRATRTFANIMVPVFPSFFYLHYVWVLQFPPKTKTLTLKGRFTHLIPSRGQPATVSIRDLLPAHELLPKLFKRNRNNCLRPRAGSYFANFITYQT